jgi:hypothetical protein
MESLNKDKKKIAKEGHLADAIEDHMESVEENAISDTTGPTSNTITPV